MCFAGATMKHFLLCSFLLVCAKALNMPRDIEWQLWKFKFSKTYHSLEEEMGRKEIWSKHLDAVKHHNNKTGATYQMGLNRFSDQLPITRPKFISNHGPILVNSVESTKLHPRAPAQFDWREKGVVFSVRNQGELGSPVAFAATDAVASLHAINHGQLYNLSTQEYADCCGGFVLGQAFLCVHHINGLCIADKYKVTNCKDPKCNQVGKVDGGVVVTSEDEAALQTAVLKAPVLVGIDAHLASFEMYESGVYSDPECSQTQLDHALLLVGYGTDSTGNDYWICKNSWGVGWGMEGYIYIARNKGNMCGIATDAQYPI